MARGTALLTHWFSKRTRGESPTPESWRLEEGIRGFRAVVVMLVLSKWYAAVVMELLTLDCELWAWRNLTERASE